MLGTVASAAALVWLLTILVKEERRVAPDPGRDTFTTASVLGTTAQRELPTLTRTRPAAPTTAARVPAATLTAARGDCWLEVYAESPTGRRLYVGILRRGRSLRFTERRLFVRAGAAEQLDVRVGGKTTGDLSGAATFFVTAAGVEPQS